MSEFEKRLEDRGSSVAEAEETLRLVARQAAPEGVAARVHGRLEDARLRAGAVKERKGFWHLWLPAHRMQFAGAAALAAIVAVSTMSLRHPAAKTPVAPAAGAKAGSGSAFRTSGSTARPGTLTPIEVPAQPTKKKKPSAGRAAKHAARSSSQSDTTGTAARQR